MDGHSFIVNRDIAQSIELGEIIGEVSQVF